MATRGLVEASLDAFWSAAGPARVRKPGAGLQKRFGRRPQAPHGRARPGAVGGPDTTTPEEFRHVSLAITGRSGYNESAINGTWHFWCVRAGRLAFRRVVELPGDSAEQAVSLRLYLQYVPDFDAWLMGDSVDGSGSVIADCICAKGEPDLQQPWRVWDGDAWCEDRNVEVEVMSEQTGDGADVATPQLKGLRVVLNQMCTAASGKPADKTAAKVAEKPPPAIRAAAKGQAKPASPLAPTPASPCRPAVPPPPPPYRSPMSARAPEAGPRPQLPPLLQLRTPR